MMGKVHIDLVLKRKFIHHSSEDVRFTFVMLRILCTTEVVQGCSAGLVHRGKLNPKENMWLH